MIDLSCGGPAWAGWRFARWGRALDWRLHAPDGTTYTVGDVVSSRELINDVAYYEHRLRELSPYTAPDALHFGPIDAVTLRTAAEIILRASRQFVTTRPRLGILAK